MHQKSQEVFALANFDVGTTGLVTMLLAGIWPAALFVLVVSQFGIIGLMLMGILIIGLLIYVNKIKNIETV